jgi:Protein of unknown function (DUF3290).
MTVYSWNYFHKLADSSINYYHVLYAFMGLAFGIILFLRMKSHIAGKHRDLLIIIGLGFLILSGIQYSNYSNGKTSSSNAQNMLTFFDSISREFKVSKSNIYVNQTSLKEGMVIEIDKDFYKVTFNNDFSSYLLDKTYLMQDEEVVVK